MTQLEAPVRYLPPRAVAIVKATDLGSVQVLKHGNRFLLTDSFGDIHPDSRGLGLYDGDTRVLACSVLRIGGIRPVLLQTSVGANYRGGIQMTNPSADRNPDAKVHPLDELTGRTIGISRERLMGAEGVSERLKIVNHAAREADVPVDLELGVDGADIFEVRGYPRPHRGKLLPVAVTDDRVTFRYLGLDDIERFTHLAFSEAAEAVTPVFGRPEMAAARKLWIAESGERAAKDRVRPVLDALGQGVFDFGEEAGAAHVVKLGGNFLIAAAIEALAESVALLRKNDVDAAAFVAMLSGTLFACPVYQNYGRLVVEERWSPPGFRLALGLKDAELVVEAASVSAAPMPFGDAIRRRFLSAVARGRGDLDWAAMALGAAEDAGLAARSASEATLSRKE